MDHDHQLNSFYTDPLVAKALVEETRNFLPKGITYTWVEPSAGDGSFFRNLPASHRIGIDIDDRLRTNSEYIIDDFLTMSLAFLPPRQEVVFIGNPPFSSRGNGRGRKRNLSLYFINRAAEFGDTVAFVVGRHFRRKYLQERIHADLHLERELPMDDVTFRIGGKNVSIKVIFQIWKRRYDNSTGEIIKRSVERDHVIKNGEWGSPDWRFTLPTDPATNVLVKRWGSLQSVGTVIIDRAIIDEMVSKNREREIENGINLGKTCTVNYHLVATDPNKVFSQFSKHKILLEKYMKHIFIGNNPTLCQEEIIKLYLGTLPSESFIGV